MMSFKKDSRQKDFQTNVIFLGIFWHPKKRFDGLKKMVNKRTPTVIFATE